MEPASQQQQQGINNDQELASGAGKNSNFLCRQSSTRWTPTSEQIRILKELYYNNGVRSPTAEQIQRISAKLRQYGKIEGKNVFYWFQNHKARERQKKRFTADHHHHHIIAAPVMHRPPPSAAAGSSSSSSSSCWKNSMSHEDHHAMNVSPFYNNFSSSNSNYGPAAAGNFASSSSTSSLGLLSVGNYGYGSVAMEKSFRECSITPSGGNGGGAMAAPPGQSFAWNNGVDPYSSSSSYSYPFLEKRKYYSDYHQTLEMEDEDQDQEAQIETLPLFPMHGGGGGDIKHHETDYFNGWHRRADDSISAAAGSGARASLELTLNSYAARFPTTSP